MHLHELPDDLLVKIIGYIPVKYLFRLQQTCRFWNHFLLTNMDVWREIAQAMTRAHNYGALTHHELLEVEIQCVESWRERAIFLAKHSIMLGWFCLMPKLPQHIIRVGIIYKSFLSSDGSRKTVIALEGRKLTTENIYSRTTTPLPPLPPNAIIENRFRPSSYHLVPESHSPDAGLSIDLFDPESRLEPFFTLTIKDGLVTNTKFTMNVELCVPVPFAINRKSRSQNFIGMGSYVSQGLNHDDIGGIPPRAYAIQKYYETRTFTKEVASLDFQLGSAAIGSRNQGTNSSDPLRGLYDWITGFGEEMDAVIKVPQPRVSPIMAQSLRSFFLPVKYFIASEGFQMVPRFYKREEEGVAKTSGSSDYFLTPSERLARSASLNVYRRNGRGPDGGPAIFIDGHGDVEEDMAEDVHITMEDDDIDIHIRRLAGQMSTFGFSGWPGTYLPIQPIAPTTVLPTRDNEIYATSLEGLWVGTFGLHGIEYGYISPSVGEYDMGIDTDISGINQMLFYTKLTGDENVPAGKISWDVCLSERSYESRDVTAQVYDSLFDNKTRDEIFGIIPTTTLEELTDLQHENPPANDLRWYKGTISANGLVALRGFADPGYTSAAVTFIREGDSVNELRVRWPELGKVSVFKRVTISDPLV